MDGRIRFIDSGDKSQPCGCYLVGTVFFFEGATTIIFRLAFAFRLGKSGLYFMVLYGGFVVMGFSYHLIC